MEHRRLGASGLWISEIAYGNWLTHASQVAEDDATACVHAALDAGITTFDTADVYAQTGAEAVLGRALAGQRREGLEIFTKVYWPTGPGRNDRGLSRKHIMEACEGSLRRLQTDHIDLYQAHRFDHHTPLEETLRAFDDLVRAGKVLYVGVSEWRAEEIRAALEIAEQMGLDRIVSNQPQYSMLWRVIEAEVVPECEAAGIGQVVWSPMAQGILTGKYLPGAARPRGLPGHRPDRFGVRVALAARRRPRAGAEPPAAGRGCRASRWRRWPWPGSWATRTSRRRSWGPHVPSSSPTRCARAGSCSMPTCVPPSTRSSVRRSCVIRPGPSPRPSDPDHPLVGGAR